MARVPLIQEQDHPEFAEVVEKNRAGRRGKLINIYRMLLNAPALAESGSKPPPMPALEQNRAIGPN